MSGPPIHSGRPASSGAGRRPTPARLYAFDRPLRRPSGILFRKSCEAFLSSFKVGNAATVGGNICMSLPAGPLITLTVAPEARYELWAPGDILRRVTVPEYTGARPASGRQETLPVHYLGNPRLEDAS
ncbi:hypothetical protein [Streptomyces aureus]|uniref:hypothetical protein n=1 Tax=Streptomyces aureus TaxID=193461 RepID=UPI003402E56A